ncbi:MAG: DNA photolyase family protein [Bacteroidetes bacterium]|nr:DNA photolyase family protein [Bacteroidota bacterium]
MGKNITIFWFRRDLRLYDNAGLFHALCAGRPVLPLFIFDTAILKELPRDDARVTFIHQELQKINAQLKKHGSTLLVRKGEPIEIFQELVKKYPLASVFTNRDYEPYAIQRDEKVSAMLKNADVEFHDWKDQVIFEKDEVVKQDGNPYTVYTPYSRKWLERFHNEELPSFSIEKYTDRFYACDFEPIPDMNDIGFELSEIKVPPGRTSKDLIENYNQTRDIPSKEGTSRMGPHLRFGTVSIREVVQRAAKYEPTFLKELIWREFFMQILFHFPKVIDHSFKPAYDNIPWINDEVQFESWCQGKTGYPMVDAGMRELNETGFMHNRVRMVTASFLCKHLLIDWRWGEAYFAEKLLDYELSSNNGNWQWAAGTGCDASPYFRVFNPESQQKKFDPDLTYIKKWVPELGTNRYPKPMIDHKFARERAIKTYKQAINR